GTEVSRQRALLKVIQDVMAGFTIRAPAPGMLIYVKEQWSGKKRTTGSQVTAWDPAVGTLPDLAKMESVTYVNEIDVRKVAVGQDSGVAYVYKQSGGRVLKQEVVTGAMNDDEVVVEQGLAEGDRVVLTRPSDQAKLKLVRLTHQAN